MSQIAYDTLIARRDALVAGELAAARERVDDIQQGGGDAEGLEAVEAVFEAERLAGEVERLDRQIADAVIVDRASFNRVEIGCTVAVDFGDGSETYRYDRTSETGVITPASPLGAALLGAGVGDEVFVEAPNGRYSVRIVSIA